MAATDNKSGMSPVSGFEKVGGAGRRVGLFRERRDQMLPVVNIHIGNHGIVPELSGTWY